MQSVSQNAAMSCENGCNIAAQFSPSQSPTTISAVNSMPVYTVFYVLQDSAETETEVYSVQVQDQFGNETRLAMVK